MQVKMVGQSKNVETEVESVDQMAEDGKIQVTAWIQEGEGRLGDLVSFTVNMESGHTLVSFPLRHCVRIIKDITVWLQSRKNHTG